MTEQQIGDQPIESAHRRMMNSIAGVLDAAFNGKARGKDRATGFVLLVFPFGDAGRFGRANYISNGADRADIVKLFKGQIRRFEGRPEQPPGLRHVAVDSRGNTLFVEPNEVGGRRYWSDEIGGGVVAWDTSLVSAEMVRLALTVEEQLTDAEMRGVAAEVIADEAKGEADK